MVLYGDYNPPRWIECQNKNKGRICSFFKRFEKWIKVFVYVLININIASYSQQTCNKENQINNVKKICFEFFFNIKKSPNYILQYKLNDDEHVCTKTYSMLLTFERDWFNIIISLKWKGDHKLKHSDRFLFSKQIVCNKIKRTLCACSCRRIRLRPINPIHNKKPFSHTNYNYGSHISCVSCARFSSGFPGQLITIKQDDITALWYCLGFHPPVLLAMHFTK